MPSRMTPTSHENRVSNHLDLIRGLAAVAVVVYHVRYRFFLDYHDVVNPGLTTKCYYALTAYGHDAVMVFFVLSGYFISASVTRDVAGGRWSWRRYTTNRLTRLYVVLIPALLLTGFWDMLGRSLYPVNPVYTGEPRSWAHDFFPVGNRLDVPTAVGNVLFLQSVLVSPLGSNEALWSLSYEFWYYVLFPLAVLGLGRGGACGRRSATPPRSPSY